MPAVYQKYKLPLLKFNVLKRPFHCFWGEIWRLNQKLYKNKWKKFELTIRFLGQYIEYKNIAFGQWASFILSSEKIKNWE